MLDTLFEKLKKLMSSRMIPLSLIFGIMFLLLVYQVFQLQIVEAYQGNLQTGESEYRQTKNRFINSTRGNILDRNGNILAYNELSYSVVMSDSGIKRSNAEKNSVIHNVVQILKEHGYELELEFGIELNKKNELVFNVTDAAELRFKKNAYYLKGVSYLSEEQVNATAEDVFLFLCYGNETIGKLYDISEEYTLEEALNIMKVRYTMDTILPRYSQFILASNVDDTTIAAIMEHQAELPDVEVQQQTSRVYNDSKYFAHILGYTGFMNEAECEKLNPDPENKMYTTFDTIGKTGIEQNLDDDLRGKKGKVQLNVNNFNKVLDSIPVSEPAAGNDVYLTIDRELQIATYHILENNINAILCSKIVNSMSYGGKGDSANKITIPIYEVYNALISNGVLDISHFYAEDATETEKKVYSLFEQKRDQVTASLRSLLSLDNKKTKAEAGEEMEAYLSYSYLLLMEKEVLKKSVMDVQDPIYLAYQEDKISLSEFLQYAISHNWVELSLLGIGEQYHSNNEIYKILIDYLFSSFVNNNEFEKKVYRTLIFNYTLSGKDLCLLLYDQEVLKYNENDYNKLAYGTVTAYQFVMGKMRNLEITPGMLALEPCSGSIVIESVEGEVLAMVTYPSYDNNRLANKIDWDYYQKLMGNKASPLLNRPTQQTTTTGSTIKPMVALIGLNENIISTGTLVTDKGIYTDVVPSPKCWKYPSSHGTLNMSGAIQHSCNYFFYDIGYKMSLDRNGSYVDQLGLSKIQKNAALFGFADTSGVEVAEVSPRISTRDSVRSAIGYYHDFTPTQISRYVTAVANKGTVYNLTLVDKIMDKNGKLVKDNKATVYNKITEFNETEWNAVHKGMYDVVNTTASSLNTIYGNLGVSVAGKTGTAQVGTNHPSHGLFISFAPFENPEISVTVVLPNGYASANAAKLAREVYGLYFNDENKEELLSGDLKTTTITNIYIPD